MSLASRKAAVGDIVYTDFSSRITRHIIVAREERRGCQSGIGFQVSPMVPKSGGADSWLDADWFELFKATP